MTSEEKGKEVVFNNHSHRTTYREVGFGAGLIKVAIHFVTSKIEGYAIELSTIYTETDKEDILHWSFGFDKEVEDLSWDWGGYVVDRVEAEKNDREDFQALLDELGGIDCRYTNGTPSEGQREHLKDLDTIRHLMKEHYLNKKKAKEPIPYLAAAYMVPSTDDLSGHEIHELLMYVLFDQPLRPIYIHSNGVSIIGYYQKDLIDEIEVHKALERICEEPTLHPKDNIVLTENNHQIALLERVLQTN